MKKHLLMVKAVMKLQLDVDEKMSRVGTKYKEVIELFDEKTGEVVRKIRFRSSRDFDEFLKKFKAMKYPGYRWRYKDNGKKKKKTVGEKWTIDMKQLNMKEISEY